MYLCVNRARLPTGHSVSVELIWNIPEAFMAQQAQAISSIILPKSARRRNTLAGKANPKMINLIIIKTDGEGKLTANLVRM